MIQKAFWLAFLAVIAAFIIWANWPRNDRIDLVIPANDPARER